MQEVLVDCLGAQRRVVGEDFHFGHQRRGNVDLLAEMGAELGFDVDGLNLVDADGAPAGDGRRSSSTAIRHALVEGDLDARPTRCSAAPTRCAAWSPTATSGAASSGSHRQRRGARRHPPAADGIYAGWYERPDGAVHPTAISLGRRPTFYEDAHASLLEAHLLDFDGDLYGEPARVRFVTRLRGEESFDSVDALVEQIGRDWTRPDRPAS